MQSLLDSAKRGGNLSLISAQIIFLQHAKRVDVNEVVSCLKKNKLPLNVGVELAVHLMYRDKDNVFGYKEGGYQYIVSLESLPCMYLYTQL